MNRNPDKERWPEEYDNESRRSRPTSRRNSTTSSTSRRNSIKRDPNTSSVANRKSSTTSTSQQSTPKRTPKPNIDLQITGRQVFKKSDRANSLPSSNRRPSTDSNKTFEITKKSSTSSKSRETSLEDDMSLDLSQVSDFEDTTSKYGLPKKFGLATSTPKMNSKYYQKPRSGSLQSQKVKLEHSKKVQQSFDSSRNGSNFTCSRDSLYKTSSAGSAYNGRYTGRSTELDYSSVSPEYSGQSSADLSPRASAVHSDVAVISPFSQRSQLSGSSCYVSWVEAAEIDRTTIKEKRRNEAGEWTNFWANYNNSMSQVPIKRYYDQCPTPYRTENIDLADLDLTDDKTNKTPDLDQLNKIIRNEGFNLTPRETQNIIKCAHILGNVLSKAIDRKAREYNITKVVHSTVDATEPDDNVEVDVEKDAKKKNLKLELKEQNKPLEIEVIQKETAQTQTDISLPNTKSAPKIFENILRQLSRSSLKEPEDKGEEQTNLNPNTLNVVEKK